MLLGEIARAQRARSRPKRGGCSGFVGVVELGVEPGDGVVVEVGSDGLGLAPGRVLAHGAALLAASRSRELAPLQQPRLLIPMALAPTNHGAEVTRRHSVCS